MVPKDVMHWSPTGQEHKAIHCGRWRLEKQITVETEHRKVMRG
jgi:hypothetical protein